MAMLLNSLDHFYKETKMAVLDERGKTNNFSRKIQELNDTNQKQVEMLVDQEEEITMLRKKLDSREARITYLNSRPWWLCALRR